MAARRTDAILDHAHSAVVSMDERGRVIYWNPSAARIFGVSQDAALGRLVSELIIPERLRQAHLDGVARFLSEGVGPLLERRVEGVALRGDGSEFPVQLTITAVREGEGWKFIAFVQDVSALREAEQERERLVQGLRFALRAAERRFETIVGELSDPVTIRDRSDQIVYANRAALRYLGFDRAEDLRQIPPAVIMADYRVLGEDGKEVTMDQIPSVRLLRGESATPLVIRTIHRESGAERWNRLKASPLLDDHGRIEATILVIEDVTEQKRAERRAEFLMEASRVLGSSLDYERTLRNVADLAVPDIADWCAVDLLDADGDRVPVSVAHVDEAKLRLADELRSYDPARPDPEQGLGLALRTGEAILYSDIPDEMLVGAAVDQRHLELLRAVGFRSAAVIPICLGRRVLGAMTLVSADSGRVLDRFDVELAEQVAARAAVAIENSRLYSERSAIAHTLQQGLLPEKLPEIPGYELASIYIPALEGAEVGGDFYDVWETPSGWLLVVGDVTGKGPEAASVTALVRHTLRTASEFVASPAELLARLDRALKQQRQRPICTALCLRLEDDQLTLAVGGHPLPIDVGPTGTRPVGEFGFILGAFDDAEWHDSHLQLAPGHTLVLYTDGVTDAVGRDRSRYGWHRLRATLDECRQLSAGELVDTLGRALRSFQAGEHADDTAALAVRRHLVSDHPAGQGAARSDAPDTLRGQTVT